MQENQNPLCKYKYLFGKVGEGIHSYRVGGFAIMDVIQTILLGFFLAWLTKISVYYTIPGSFLLGIVAHRLFCVRTTVDKILFPDG
jgi:hypothetical protein